MTAKAFPRKKRPYMFAMTPTANALFVPHKTVKRRGTEQVRNHPPNSGTDLTLIWELGADKMIGDPTKARDRHEDGLFRVFHLVYPHTSSRTGSI
jgi:hypothetical protein